jgi:hypothetical protein
MANLLCSPVLNQINAASGNLEASVRSRDTDDAKRSAGDLIEAGLN